MTATTVMNTLFFSPLVYAAVGGTQTGGTVSGAGTTYGDNWAPALASWTREGVVDMQLQRIVKTRRLPERRKVLEAGKAAIGLGDALDVTYNVLVQVGDVSTPLVLDTGSADLWVLSTNCSACADASYPFYSSNNFQPIADARLLYGDSRTGTHAIGLVGTDRAGVAGLVVERQYFAAINNTNTSVLETGSAGILGLGFPVNSILWNELYTLAASGTSLSRRDHPTRTDLYSRPRSLPPRPPSFASLQNLATDDDVTNPEPLSNTEILPSFSTYGPLVARLALSGGSAPSFLASPQFAVTLQRTTPSLGGNIGMLTLGGLPSGVDNASLIWVPVRRYTKEQNGVVVPQASEETYPYTWEVPLGSVYFDGVRLSSSTLGDVAKEGVGSTALIDTGNSLIRGPPDVIMSILALLVRNGSTPSSPFATPPSLDAPSYDEEQFAGFTRNFESLAYAYPCEAAHSLSFEFAGKMVEVDPRDFGRPVGDDDAYWCVPNLAPTDPPEMGGYLYSWSLGEPFLRSTLASFYYGNLTHPSADPPRIGFLSTAPDDASQRLDAAAQSAQDIGSYPETTISAPSATQVDGPVTTNSQGIVQASEAPLASDVISSAASDRSGQGRDQGSGTSCVLCSAFGAEFRIRTDLLVSLGLGLFGIGFLL